jgi:uncharacterized membrane protein
MKLPDPDIDALALAVMAAIEGSETEGLRHLMWRVRLEGIIAGAVIGWITGALFWAVMFSPLLKG